MPVRLAATLASLVACLAACTPGPATAPPEICAASEAAPPAAAGPAHAAFRVLVFSRATGFQHASRHVGVTAVQVLGSFNNFSVEATEDPTTFTDANLARFAAVVFLSTTGEVLDPTQQAAFERYIRAGHGFVGVHSASDTEYGWAWYHALLGATFASHPPLQQGTATIVATGAQWVRTDEWYNFRALPSGVTVLARVDESTYTGGTMGADHPITWRHTYDGGRAWYTAMGHTACSYSERTYLDQLLNGILWAAGVP